MNSVESSGISHLHGIGGSNSRIGHTKSHSHSSSKNTPKSMAGSFDLAPLGGDLPPNTGPAGSVSSSASSSKNLSHVPCKFYRQGICQAGSSCPFSHNLDGSAAADKLPCKYFQKGNCKFGLKCALAHFLPDGTRVNSKGLGRQYRDHHHHGSGSHGSGKNGGAKSHHGNSHSISASPPAVPSASSSTSLSGAAGASAGGFAPSTTNYLGPNATVSASAPVSSGLGSAGVFGFQPDPFGSQTQIASFINIKTGRSLEYSNPTSSGFSSSNTTPTGMLRSYSNATSPITLNRSSPQSNFFPSVSLAHSPNGSLPLSFGSKPFARPFFEDAPDADYRTTAYESVFEEDYVPASLGDLILTPQEQQRRDSRSQSGTLLVRPNLNTLFSSNTMKDFELKDDKASNEVFMMD